MSAPKVAVFLSEGAIEHLGEIMREETDGCGADLCIHCREILCAAEKAAEDFEVKQTPEERREDEEAEDAERRLDAEKAGDL